MDYENLSQIYFDEGEILKKHIKSLKTRYVEIGDEPNNEDIPYRVKILYGMYLDLVHTAKYLKRKYEVMKK